MKINEDDFVENKKTIIYILTKNTFVTLVFKIYGLGRPPITPTLF